jgi:hypothetical protein
VSIKVFTVENDKNDGRIKDFMVSKGYVFAKKLGIDDVYIKG